MKSRKGFMKEPLIHLKGNNLLITKTLYRIFFLNIVNNYEVNLMESFFLTLFADHIDNEYISIIVIKNLIPYQFHGIIDMFFQTGIYIYI